MVKQQSTVVCGFYFSDGGIMSYIEDFVKIEGVGRWFQLCE